MQERLLSTKQVCDLTSLSRTSIWRLERQGEFPSARPLFGKRKAYVEREVREWIAGRVEQVPA